MCETETDSYFKMAILQQVAELQTRVVELERRVSTSPFTAAPTTEPATRQLTEKPLTGAVCAESGDVF